MTERTAPVRQLSPLVGSWTIESPQFPGIPGGSATFEWIEDGAYLLHRSFAPDPVPDGIMIVGGDDDVDSANLTLGAAQASGPTHSASSKPSPGATHSLATSAPIRAADTDDKRRIRP